MSILYRVKPKKGKEKLYKNKMSLRERKREKKKDKKY